MMILGAWPNFRQQKSPIRGRALMNNISRKQDYFMSDFKNTQTKHAISALKRVLLELTAINNNKSRVGTAQIRDFLKERGVEISLRTVQRDLRLMQELGLPVYSDDCSPKGWRIDVNNPLSDVVGFFEAA